MVYDIMNDKQRKAFEEFFETDFSFEIPKLARFRVNAFNQNRAPAPCSATFRPPFLTLDELNSPKTFKDLCMLPADWCWSRDPPAPANPPPRRHGQSLQRQSAGSHYHDRRSIEFVHESKRCLVNQREVHRDTLGFTEALRSALREDPDVVLVGKCAIWRPFAWR